MNGRTTGVAALAFPVSLASTAFAQSSGRHGDGHAQMHDKYKLQHPPLNAGDGRSHLCEKGQFIYCFAPGEIRG